MGRHRSRSMSSTSSGRGAQSSKWDGRSGHRLHVSDLAAGISRRELERAFAKYGSINEVWVATNPPCFAFINFTHRDDAEKALREVDGKMIGTTRVGVTWARERTFGGRSRGAPYGSYRNSGGNRRRSRSRSGSNSRREKRRHSRSRSPDRQRRRSKSPRDRKRSRRTSKEKNESPNHSKNESRSRDPTINIETTTDSASTAKPVENNTQNRSPIIIDSE